MLYRVPPTQSVISVVEKVTENKETKIIVICFKKVQEKYSSELVLTFWAKSKERNFQRRWNEGLANNICIYSSGLAKLKEAPQCLRNIKKR